MDRGGRGRGGARGGGDHGGSGHQRGGVGDRGGARGGGDRGGARGVGDCDGARGGGDRGGARGGGDRGGARGGGDRRGARGGGDRRGAGGGGDRRGAGGGGDRGGARGGGDRRGARGGGDRGGRGYQKGGGGERGSYQRGGGFHRGGGGRGSALTYPTSPNPYPIGPYEETYSLEQRRLPSHEIGWKPLPENQEDVKIQKYSGSVGQWALKKIEVSVNHYLLEPSIKTTKPYFPIPTLYHYDISYGIIRKRRDDRGDAEAGPSQTSTSTGGGGRGRGEAKRKRVSDPLSAVTQQLEVMDLEEGKKQGGKQPSKQLPKHLTKSILDYLIPKIRIETGHQAIATDGSFNLYSTKQFRDAKIEFQYSVTFEELRQANLFQDEDNATVHVTIQPTVDKATGQIHTIDTQEIARYVRDHGSLKGYQFTAELRQSLEGACNAFVRSMPNFQYFSVGRSTMVPCDCDEKHRAYLGGGLEAWKGISANIAMGWKPYLNVDIGNCAFMLNRDVREVLNELLGNKWSTVNKWNSLDLDEVRSFLRTCKICYKIDGQKRSGPIRDVPQGSVSSIKFRWEDKKKDVTIFQYYKERYGHTLEYRDGPVLEIRKKGCNVPAELCVIKSGQSYNRKLDGYQTTKMLDFAKRGPGETVGNIEKRMKGMNLKGNGVLKGLGVQVADQILKLEARVLVPPTLRYGGKKDSPEEIAHINPDGGQWDIRDNFDFYKAAHVNKWGILVFGCQRVVRERDIQDFVEMLRENGEKKGVEFGEGPSLIKIDKEKNRRFSTPEVNAEDLVRYFEEDFKGCDLCVVVFPKKGSPLYGHIKHAAEVECGMLTQCVAERNVCQPNDATVQNILLKINSKLGGINHVTVKPLLEVDKAKQWCSLLLDCPVMILGADVTHAPPGSKKTVGGKEFVMPSYAAVTGSLDKTCMPFMTEIRAQRKANAGAAEVIQDLEGIVDKMLKCFRESSKGMNPFKILYFRDGVGEGQFAEVLHIEMNAIRRACLKVEASYQPKITFITVQKRHKTRIFWNAGKGGFKNAPAGTVIDKEIVHPSETDFYLLSHRGMLGTSRPSRYHVLWDDSDFSQDELQSLAYTLCYMYVRCTKSVKMPAATYYAHLAADRAKKLCEGFESTEPTEENLNKMLERRKLTNYPMHFV